METTRNEVIIYPGNTRTKGVNRFYNVSEEQINGISKIIDFFRSKGFTESEISLWGGVSEVSHTGDLAYGATYENKESFVDNGLADFKKATDDAKKEYQDWATSLNYENISIKLNKGENGILIILGSAKDMTILFDDTAEIKSLVKTILSDIKKEIYNNNCLVSGFENLIDAKKTNKKNSADQLSDTQSYMYLITYMEDYIPLLIQNNIVLLYSDVEKAEAAVQRFRKIYDTNLIKYHIIEDKPSFFAKMAACGLEKFLLNGDGKLWAFANFTGEKRIKQVGDVTKLLEEIKYYQPNKSSQRVNTSQQRITTQTVNKRNIPTTYNDPSNTKSGLVSLIFGLIATFGLGIGYLCIIPSLIAGFISISKTRKENIKKDKKAIWGLILSFVQLAFFILGIVVGIYEMMRS